ncbi:MAG: HNH endonuclease [Fusobacteriaceae bacterium]
MKKLTRLSKPQNYTLDSLANYKELFDSNGDVKKRWNYKSSFNKELKEVLLKMSGYECAYCGKSLDEWDIDHYLPQSKFPYLSYCFDNMLPSCKKCNQDLKKTYFPLSLMDKKNFAEEHIYSHIAGKILYRRDQVLDSTKDRIIEPTFDIPDEHLEFNPLTCEYSAKSSIGKETLRVFFNDRKDFTKKLQELSNQIFLMMNEGVSEEVILNLAKLMGYSFYCEKIYKYWKEEIF